MSWLRGIPYYLVKFTCWLVLRLRFGMEVTGQEHVPKQGAFIIACNHVSHLDPVVLGCACPRRITYMARTTLWEPPLLRLFMNAMQCIPLKRGEADVGAIREAARQLKAGRSIGLFPEGTRQPSGQLGQAKRGIGLLAALAKVPVVPAVVQGTYEALPKGAKRLQRSKIRVAFGPLIPYTTAVSRKEALSGANSDGAPQNTERRATSGKGHDQLAEAVTRQWQQLLASMKESPHGANQD